MKLAIGICNYQSHVHSMFFRSFMSIESACDSRVMIGHHPWDAIRNNMIISDFLKSDCTHLVKMDTDQVYPRDYFVKMLPLLGDHDVIGPMIYDRGSQSGFMPLCKKTDGPGETPFWPPESTHDGRTGIEQVPYLHTNCFYNRYVLEALTPPYYESYMTEDGLRRANHVDYTFMKKISDSGFKIFVNNDVVVGHISEIPITRDFYERYNGAH